MLQGGFQLPACFRALAPASSPGDVTGRSFYFLLFPCLCTLVLPGSRLLLEITTPILSLGAGTVLILASRWCCSSPNPCILASGVADFLTSPYCFLNLFPL